LKIKKAIIPAAGMGTRFLPATKAQPKEMLPIVDKPTIQYIVEEAVNSGIEDILIITGRGKRAIEDHFDKSYELEDTLRKKNKTDMLEIVEHVSNMVQIHYIRQKEPKGLGDAILCAESFINNEPFAVLLGDDIIQSEVPCLRQMTQVYDKCNCSVVGVQKVPMDTVSSYGIIKYNQIEEDLYEVIDMVEKPEKEFAPSNIAVLGRYILSPQIFSLLRETKPGKGNEIQLTDAIKKLIGLEHVYAYEFKGKRYDVGDKLGYLKATVEFAYNNNELREDFFDYLVKFIEENKA
jgi:UTP--glucose-1-phosphate uridylyltransferase